MIEIMGTSMWILVKSMFSSKKTSGTIVTAYESPFTKEEIRQSVARMDTTPYVPYKMDFDGLSTQPVFWLGETNLEVYFEEEQPAIVDEKTDELFREVAINTQMNELFGE
jgi:hypothetical protein